MHIFIYFLQYKKKLKKVDTFYNNIFHMLKKYKICNRALKSTSVKGELYQALQ